MSTIMIQCIFVANIEKITVSYRKISHRLSKSGHKLFYPTMCIFFRRRQNTIFTFLQFFPDSISVCSLPGIFKNHSLLSFPLPFCYSSFLYLLPVLLLCCCGFALLWEDLIWFRFLLHARSIQGGFIYALIIQAVSSSVSLSHSVPNLPSSQKVELLSYFDLCPLSISSPQFLVFVFIY